MSPIDRLYDENDWLRERLAELFSRRSSPADIERVKGHLRANVEAITAENLRLKQKRKRAA
jgi:hypothetical protein